MAQIDDTDVIRRLALHVGVIDPETSLQLKYLTEGAANVIFTAAFTSSDTELNRKSETLVLRLRKDLSFTTSAKQAIGEFEDRIAPLFTSMPSLLLPQTLLELSNSTVESLNDELCALEYRGARPKNRCNVYLPSFDIEPYGLLLPNLHAISGRIVEFKPKWLAQSPSAPRDAQTCRTCALNSSRRSKGSLTGRGDSGFCPFDLLSTHDSILEGALTNLWPNKDTLHAFSQAFRKRVQPALRLLQDLQRQNNEVGLHDFKDAEGKDFSVAMALRDCSFFLNVVTVSDTGVIDINLVKILDLDLKDAGGGKLAKWAGMEEQLIEGGWYYQRSTGEDGLKCAMAFG